MIDTKLILIEGLSGAGKSTIAQRLWLHLCRQGFEARWFYEHDTAHPIWWPGEQSRIAAEGVVDPAFLNETLLARWRGLADEQAVAGTVTIMESAFFQTAIGFLLAMKFPDREIEAHVLAVERAIAGLDPVLVYFRRRDVARALNEVFEDRRNDRYDASLVEHIGGTPYGKAHGLNDVAGLVRYAEHWCELVESLYMRLGMAKVAIDRSSGDWPSRERQLADFLGLPAIVNVDARIERASRFLGCYRDANSSDELVVAGDEQGLHLADARLTRLIPDRERSFHVEAMCVELSFADERGGLFQRCELRGNLPDLSPVWVRTEQPR